MKKVLKIVFLFCFFTLLICGCGVKNADDVLKKMISKYNKVNGYYAEGVMEILNNENSYTYNVSVSYKKKDYYKINLVNTLNNHEQVILRNDDGVYVVTPSLNKSFKFQSDWPYNNSQVYLLNSVVDDIKEDENKVLKVKDKYYYFVSSVNYPNNKLLVKQNVYVDKNMKISKVEVTDKDGKVQITMKFNKIVFDKKFSKDYFELSKLIKINSSNSDASNKSNNDTMNNNSNSSNNDNSNNSTDNSSNMNTDSNNSTTTNNTNSNTNTNSDTSTNSNTKSSSNNTNESSSNSSATSNESSTSKDKKTASISDVIYPMYLPDNTTLANKEIINTNDGERLILTFSGDNPFVLVEETVSYNENGLIVPVSGNLDFLNDVIGVVNDNSVSFESNGIGYYIVSDKLEKTELVNIARSISVLPVSK